MDPKEIENLKKAKAWQSIGSSYVGRWYTWDSPIGLSIFFLTITAIGIAVVLTVKLVH
jgi:hypothetical protein